MMNKQLNDDIVFVKRLLPSHYSVTESNKKGSIHCKSSIGIRLSLSSDKEDDEMWSYIVRAIKQKFGERFSEIFHNTCFCHVDFTIYLKQSKC